jgi:arylsulfatase A
MKHPIDSRNKILLTAAAIITGLCFFTYGVRAQQAGTDQPNILFIYLDDLGYGDVTCYNPDSKIHTPHMDRLAKEGMLFTDAHTPAAICGPSRYGLITGRYPWRRGKGGTGNGPKFRDLFIEKGRTTLASLLQTRDYNCAQIGKWGIRHNYSDAVKPGKEPGHKDSYDFPNKRLLGAQAVGFDYSWCMTHLFPAPGTKEIGHSKHLLENGLPIDPTLSISDPYRWLPDSAMKVVEYLGAYAGKKENPKFGINRQSPFFIYWDPPSPHTPIVPNKEFQGKSGAGDYGDFVLEIDHCVGAILDALDKLQLSDNTLVILSSDNGPETFAYQRIQKHRHYSMGSLRGVKRDAWEGGHRVPLLVRWPGVVQPGRSNAALVSLTDWLATFADIAGFNLSKDAGEDSVSILPLLKGSNQPVRESVIHHSASGKFAIRQGDWLFIDYKTGDGNSGPRKEPDWFRKERGVVSYPSNTMLFNLKDDPQQKRNLYKNHPEKAGELKKLLDDSRSAPQ